MKRKIFKIALFLSILTVGIGCDQTTKEIAREQLAYQAPIHYMEGLFILTYYENSGAFLGMGEQLSPTIKMFFLLLLPLFFLFIISFHLLKSNYPALYFTGFCLLIAGGIGNLMDRFLDGFVVDFMHIQLIDGIKTGVFNFADVYITLGVMLVFLHFYKEK